MQVLLLSQPSYLGQKKKKSFCLDRSDSAVHKACLQSSAFLSFFFFTEFRFTLLFLPPPPPPFIKALLRFVSKLARKKDGQLAYTLPSVPLVLIKVAQEDLKNKIKTFSSSLLLFLNFTSFLLFNFNHA